MIRPKEKPISIGIIGLGGVAQAHLQAYELLDNIKIVSVCDVRKEVVKEISQRIGAKPYTDYHELLASGNIELVIVLTPASTHREIVEAVADYGIHVFCEKPIAVTLKDAEAMVAKCKQAEIKFFYGSCYRYLPAIVQAKQLIQAGTIGKVQLLTEQLIGGHGKNDYVELTPIHYPIGGPGGPGMGLVDHGIHLIDVFAWLNESEIVAAHGAGLISGSPASSEYMVMQMANGAMGHLIYNAATYTSGLPNEGMFSGGRGWLTDASVIEAGRWENEPASISVYGDKGSLRIFHYANALFINTGSGPRQVALSGRPAFGHFATQLEDCVKAIKDHNDPPVTGEDGIKALKALLEVYR